MKLLSSILVSLAILASCSSEQEKMFSHSSYHTFYILDDTMLLICLSAHMAEITTLPDNISLSILQIAKRLKMLIVDALEKSSAGACLTTLGFGCLHVPILSQVSMEILGRFMHQDGHRYAWRCESRPRRISGAAAFVEMFSITANHNKLQMEQGEDHSVGLIGGSVH